MYNYKARFYDDYITHFTQPDSIIPNLYDPQSLNRYAYARNNPVRYNDPTGHVCQEADLSGHVMGVCASGGIVPDLGGGIPLGGYYIPSRMYSIPSSSSSSISTTTSTPTINTPTYFSTLTLTTTPLAQTSTFASTNSPTQTIITALTFTHTYTPTSVGVKTPTQTPTVTPTLDHAGKMTAISNWAATMDAHNYPATMAAASYPLTDNSWFNKLLEPNSQALNDLWNGVIGAGGSFPGGQRFIIVK